ncbi:MAG: septum formation initiator family protein [Desulfobacteraceae bacterium]|nr:septum formation initiator family protein [Desulfobacteraceae bacterium]
MSVIEKTGFYFSIFILVVLLFLIVFSKNGILDSIQIQKNEKAVIKRISDTEEKNRKVATEIKSLKNDLEYIKHIARHEHDMAAEDELIFKSQNENKETPE